MRKHSPDNEINPGIIKADIVTAEQSISFFKAHKIKDIKNIAAFHLQQAAEKLIKIQLYDSSVQLQNSKLYTHNIEALLAYADENQITLLFLSTLKKML